MSRAAAFQQKKGPTDEEIKAQIRKESGSRRFGKELNKLLQAQPSKNPLALEFKLKNKNNEDGAEYGTEDIVAEEYQEQLVPVGIPRVSRRASVPPPPPPPKKVDLEDSTITTNMKDLSVQSTGEVVMKPPPPGAVPPPHNITEELSTTTEATTVTSVPFSSPWTYVFEGEEFPYYWNIETNETTFETPDGYTGAKYSAQEWITTTDGEETAFTITADMWQEVIIDGSSDTNYVNMVTGATRSDRPHGTVYIISTPADSGLEQEETWQEYLAEDGYTYYYNNNTGESVYDRPKGLSTIYEHA